MQSGLIYLLFQAKSSLILSLSCLALVPPFIFGGSTLFIFHFYLRVTGFFSCEYIFRFLEVWYCSPFFIFKTGLQNFLDARVTVFCTQLYNCTVTVWFVQLCIINVFVTKNFFEEINREYLRCIVFLLILSIIFEG